MSAQYIPGVCNINPVEIRKRRITGHIGLTIAIAFIFIAIALQFSWILRLAVFVPAFIAATGYLQAHNKFCVGFAMARQQNADDGEMIEITNKQALDLDKKKTRSMNLQATLIAAAVTVIVCIIPL